MVTAVIALVVTAIVLIAQAAGRPGPGPTPTASAEPPVASPAPTPTPTPTPDLPPGPDYEALAAEASSGGSCGGDAWAIDVLVNKQHPLCPVGYAPEVRAVAVPSAGSEQYLRPEAAERLEAMHQASLDETGLGFLLASGYRSYDAQVSTYGYWVELDGQAVADTYSARPGYSEHQTGLAMDVVDLDNACNGEACFGSTAEGLWIAENAWRFGFIVRYPDGHEATTGYIWEPWHLRYVGADIAAAMHDRGIATYEDYLGAGPAPGYLR